MKTLKKRIDAAKLKLYSKDFSTGAVVLGGNASSGNSMYTVIIK